jgi:hypothetical protein
MEILDKIPFDIELAKRGVPFFMDESPNEHIFTCVVNEFLLYTSKMRDGEIMNFWRRIDDVNDFWHFRIDNQNNNIVMRS